MAQNYLKDSKLPFILLFITFYLFSVYPFLQLKYIPFMDLPNHLVAGTAIKNIILGGELSNNFHFNGFFPNILSWLIIAAINIFFDILTTTKIIILLYFLITPLSIYYYLDEDKKYLSFLSFLFLNNSPLNMGLLNFAISIPLLFLTLGAYKKNSKLFYIFSPLLFTAHAYTFGICVLLLVIFHRFGERKDNKKIIYSLSILLIGLMIIFLPAPSSQNTKAATQFSINDLVLSTFGGFISIIAYYLVYTFQFFRPDYFEITGFIIIILLYLKQIFWNNTYDRKTLYCVLLVLIMVFFNPPTMALGNSSANWNSFNNRLIPIAVLLNLTDLRLNGRLKKLTILLFLVLVAVSSLTIAPLYHAADNRLIQNFEPALEKLPKNGRAYILFETRYDSDYIMKSKNTYGINYPGAFFSGYYSLKGGYCADYFGTTMPSVWPISYNIDLKYPLCKLNDTTNCYFCFNKGFHCGKEKDNLTGENTCVYCQRPFEVACRENKNQAGNFIIKDRCIQCRNADVGCVLNNSLVRENFDYVVAYSTNDDIDEFKTGDALYASTHDVIIYKINKTSTQPSQT